MQDSRDHFFTRLKAQREESHIEVGSPFFCDILLSERCNMRCRKCYFWKHGIEEGLNIEECRRFISSLSGIVKGPFEINLGGGEPLLKEGILELVGLCAQQGLQPAISTNATLIDEALAERLSKAGLHRLSISLDSLNAATHDAMTGCRGSHKRLMKAIRHLKRFWRKGDLNIHTVISELNIRDIERLTKWVNADSFFTGIAFQAIAQPFRTEIVPQWYRHAEYGALWPKDPARVSAIIDGLIERKRRGFKIINPEAQLAVYKKYYDDPDSFVRAHRCNFGDYMFNVNVLGFVHLCCFMPPIGNIKNSSIQEIWHSQEAQRTRELMRNCQKSCNNIVNCYFQVDENSPG